MKKFRIDYYYGGPYKGSPQGKGFKIIEADDEYVALDEFNKKWHSEIIISVNEADDVLFFKELGGVFAVFPNMIHSFNGYRKDNVTCYSHVGQHSACHPDYYQKLRLAKEDEYLDLKKELEGQGYCLNILTKKPRITKVKTVSY